MEEPDFYDYHQVEKFHSYRMRKYRDLVKKWHDAKEKGDKTTKEKALKAMSKHKAQEEKYKNLADKSGYYWY